MKYKSVLLLIIFFMLFSASKKTNAQYFGVSGQYNTLLKSFGIGGKYLYEKVSIEGLYFFTGARVSEFDSHYNNTIELNFKNSWQVGIDYNFNLSKENGLISNFYLGCGYFRYEVDMSENPNTQIASASTDANIYLSTLEGHVGYLYGKKLFLDVKLGYLLTTKAKGSFTMEYENIYGNKESGTVDFSDLDYQLIKNTYFTIGVGYLIDLE